MLLKLHPLKTIFFEKETLTEKVKKNPLRYFRACKKQVATTVISQFQTTNMWADIEGKQCNIVN